MVPRDPEAFTYAINIRNLDSNLGGRKILDNFNMAIQKGHKVALVGHHGSGKHTLFGLILMNYELEKNEKTCFKILGYDYETADPIVMRE